MKKTVTLILTPPNGKIVNVDIQKLGRVLANLEEKTRILRIYENEEKEVVIVFYNEKYMDDEFTLELKLDGETISHNEATFFEKAYEPQYRSYTLEPKQEDDDYESSYEEDYDSSY